MVFVPGLAILREMVSEKAGLWPLRADNDDESSLVVKLATPVIKAIHQGARSSFLVSVMEYNDSRVRFIGLVVYDDEEHPAAVSQPSISHLQQTRFEELLEQSRFRVHFFDENVRPVLSATGSLAAELAKGTLAGLQRTSPHYTGPQNLLTSLAHDLFIKDQDAIFTGGTSSALVSQEIPLSIAPDPHEVLIAEYGRGQFRLIDEDEGGGLEQSAHGLLEFVYGENTYRSPIVERGKIRRELTDLIGFDSSSICIVESKALAVLGMDQPRPSQRRSRLVDRSVAKAIRQLTGAIKQIRTGAEVSDRLDNSLQFPNRGSCLIHAVILVSDMNAELDYRSIATSLLDASGDEPAIFFHLLDLAELQRLTALSHGDSQRFSEILLFRWNALKQTGNAFIVSKVSLYE